MRQIARLLGQFLKAGCKLGRFIRKGRFIHDQAPFSSSVLVSSFFAGAFLAGAFLSTAFGIQSFGDALRDDLAILADHRAFDGGVFGIKFKRALFLVEMRRDEVQQVFGEQCGRGFRQAARQIQTPVDNHAVLGRW